MGEDFLYLFELSLGIVLAIYNKEVLLGFLPYEGVIVQFVARSRGYKIEGQTGVTGTYPTQCHHNEEVLSI